VRTLVLAVALAAISPASAITLAAHGRAEARLFLARDASLSERTAAAELARYLGEATSAPFRVEEEPADPYDGPAVYIGPTRFAARRGIDGARMDSEEWTARAGPGWLVLAGGRPRGTLYAVYHLLERHVGVRWWSPFEERVPSKRRLVLDGMDERGKPAFVYREVYGIDGPKEFLARHFVNGDASGVPPALGGGFRSGTPWPVHSFYFLVPPETWFRDHPEYFSERAGFRAAGRSQLCLSNADVRDRVVEVVDARLAESAARETDAGADAPILADVSQNDWGGPCRCSRCRAAAERTGSQAGPILEFVNSVADGVGRNWPGVLLTTLAYRYSFPPPEGVTARDNVVVRLSGFGRRDYARAADDPANATFRDAVIGWSGIARHLWIWDYAVSCDVDRGLPLATYSNYARDLRFYRDHGVEGVFTQHEYPIAGDLRDLKVWLWLETLEDPQQDPDRLIREFTEGFYGRAGRRVREYLRLLEAAQRRNPVFIDVNAGPSDYGHVDLDFVSAAERIFDRAEHAVRSDPVLLRRVRHARLSLDYAILSRWDALAVEALRRAVALPWDRRQVAERYRGVWREQIDFRLPEDRRMAARAEVDEEVAEWTAVAP
jgi:hypothetical protein